jgi:hypothetical protein
MQSKKFKLDVFENDEYILGVTCGTLWNGWQCPNFTFENAQKIIKHFDNDFLSYDKDKDVFYTKWEDEESEIFEPVLIDGKKFYPIGAFSWCWFV